MATSTAPVRIHLFSYKVGFGDCFLLRFVYPDRKNRHVLIDFGSSALPKGLRDGHMSDVARDIADKCGGRLDAVVATHRHLDHISGFATAKNGKGSGDIIRALKPKVVVQPWTEQPDLAEDAKAPAAVRSGSGRHKLALQRMNEVAAMVVRDFDRLGKGFSKEVADRIRFIGETNIKNLSAVKNLQTMGPNVYTYFGAKSGLDGILPGVKTTVLGPPTREQADGLEKMRSHDDSEYWHLRLARLKRDLAPEAEPESPFPGHPTDPGGKLPMSVRWIASRVQKARADELLQIVTILDDALNNTSVILLFEVGGRKLLFSGDAQIENWQYALGKPAVLKALADVDLYKVGHHGSLNATPKTLWQQFAQRGGGTKKQNRLITVLSTRADKHGTVAKGTEVPRTKLVDALRKESELHDTREIPDGQLCDELVIEVK
ncbi:MAG: hypothetical protein HZC22_03490 [Rhodocyclales bacterium]|nr:hypothetical protein [Rhodocyclales bacterium]